MGTAGIACLPAVAADAVPEPVGKRGESPGRIVRLSEDLAVYLGPINVGIVLDGTKALLIDCGDGSVLDALRAEGITVERVLFTHHHRDQACGAPNLVDAGAKLSVPAAERDWFANVPAYWKDPKSRWHIYNQRPHHLMLVESLPVDATVSEGQEISWGRARIRVLATPGHTDGSVSYVAEARGKRAVFCGDAICDEGRVWDLFSLQKGTMTTDYHGFLGARPLLLGSLGRIKLAGADWLAPSHGKILDHPARAIDALEKRLDVCYDKYVAISALRHYFPKMFAEFADRKDHMPFSPAKDLPGCLRHIGTTWILISKDRAAFVMDCGSANVVKRLQEMLAQGEIRSVEGLWVTHYHDDHVDAIPEFQKAFDCPCFADRAVADVIADPLAWRLPCISPSRARVDRVTRDGESWQWREFKLTAFSFPGQTLYHGGLMAESGDLKMFFTGDSFTPGGIDDYCPQNRTWLGRGVGFDRCLEILERIRPTHLFNCHVDFPWEFTPEQIRFMRANLAEREKLYGELFPWDHANYGMDEAWARCHPYEQRAKPGEEVTLRVVVTNHSHVAKPLACRAVLPPSWKAEPTAWAETEVPSKKDGQVPLSFRVPGGLPPGRHVVAIDLHFGSQVLPQFTEAVLVV